MCVIEQYYSIQMHIYQYTYTRIIINQRIQIYMNANTYPKKLEGLCIGVLSGDRILFQGPPDRQNGGFKQKILYLSGVQAPKYDFANSKEEKYGFAAREFMRKKLVGKKLTFIVEKKINQMELGYVLDQGVDSTIALLSQGLAKLRGDKSASQNIDAYKDAEQDAQMAQIGVWNEGADKKAYRQLNKQLKQQQVIKTYKGKTFKAIVQQVHPSKTLLYLPKQNAIVTLNYSQVQTVVLSQKLANGQSKNNARAIRSVLESLFLQREVNVTISQHSKDSIIGFITNNDGVDVRKVLLQNGFAKLSKDAMEGVSTKQFMELKKVAQSALEEGKGLWKEQKVTKSSVSNSKQFTGTVVEVHSGDSISILGDGKKQTIRIFFPHVRSPAANQPFSFQSKQALRKKCIGKNVQVQIQFTKKIPVKKIDGTGQQIKDFTCASVFQGNTNLGAYMLEQGLVTMQQIRTQQEVSRHLEQLKQADVKGKKQKKGLNSNQNVKIPTYNDLSGGKGKKIDASKSKTTFAFLQDEQHLTGVIQVVLNGSRFKVRFNEQHVMAIVVLDGVRCVPNQGQFTKISEEALNYAKKHAYQRDCQIRLKRVDLKGVYHAQLFINKKDWAEQLLQNGLAVTVQRNKLNFYEQIQAKARANKIGLWKYQLNLSSVKGGQVQKQFKQVNFTKTLVLSEVASANQFYLESEGCKKPEISQKPTPASSVKIGELYSVQFTDGIYYRAKIVKQTKAGYDAHFIDYGNYDLVPKSKIGQLEEPAKKLKSPLFKASLYGLQNLTKQAFNILCDCLNKKLKVQIKEQAEDGQSRVVLYDKDICINMQLLELGEAENTSNNPVWEKAEETARRNREGKWSQE